MPNETMTDEAVAQEDGKMEEVKRDCSTCRWWIRARPTPDKVEVWGMEMFPFGECRAQPPTALAGDRRMQAQNDKADRAAGTSVPLDFHRIGGSGRAYG